MTSLRRLPLALLVLLLVALFVVAIAGCPSKHTSKGSKDDACVDGAMRCRDPHTALVCDHGKESVVSCKGHHGCRTVGDGADCDETLAAAGDACVETADTSHACTVDHDTELACKDGKFRVLRRCRGEKACSVHGDDIECDTTKGVEGDACVEGTTACSVDGHAIVACVDGRMRARRTCRGPKACVVDFEGKPACDDSVASIGDPCDVEGKSMCSVDAKALLRCEHGKLARKTACFCKGGGCVSECDLY